MRRAAAIAATAIAVLAALAAAAWLLAPRALATPSLPSEDVPAGTPPLPAPVAEALADAQALLVTWSARAGARLEPCGCVSGMNGGLARRSALLARVPRDRSLRLELGGWSGGGADYQLERARFYLRGLALAGIAAVGLGGPEARLGEAKLGRLLSEAAAAGVPVANANLARADGSRIGQPLVACERLGRRFAITAVAPAGTYDGLVAGDPAEAIAALLPSVGGAALVVLADLDPAGCEALARAVPGVALVLGGDTHEPSPAPVAAGAARVLWAGNDGKTLGWWRWGSATCAFELISDAVPDRAALRSLIHDYQEALGAMDLAIDERLPGMTALRTGAADARYVGSSACLGCHPGAAKVHGASRHAHALATLEGKNYHRDPDCLRCHVVGLSLPDGYKRKQPRAELAEVGCESCHGRGSAHVAERSAGRAASGTLEPVTPATCVRCHDAENSPRFDYPVYWERIRHDAR